MKITSLILLSFVFFQTTGATDDDSESAVEAECAEGWTLLADTCGDTESKVCVKIGHPLKFVSWSHMQYVCDMAGGYLPEPTNTTKAQLKLILESYHQLYGETLMYLGATDVTHQNEWKWFKSKADIGDGDTNWGNDKPSKTDNKDCLAQSSGTGKWRKVDCEENSHEDRVAFLCMTALTTTPTPTPSCKSGWKEHQDACYIYQAEKKTWDDASAACQKLHNGAHLTSIKNAEENEFLYTLVKYASWIGAHRLPENSDGTWTWSDKTKWSYTRWLNSPDLGIFRDSHCVVARTGFMANAKCSATKPFLCKYSL